MAPGDEAEKRRQAARVEPPVLRLGHVLDEVNHVAERVERLRQVAFARAAGLAALKLSEKRLRAPRQEMGLSPPSNRMGSVEPNGVSP